MIDPRGRFSSAIDTALLFERTDCATNPKPFRERREIAASYVRAERRHPSSMARLVQQHGADLANGWRVWGEA